MPHSTGGMGLEPAPTGSDSLSPRTQRSDQRANVDRSLRSGQLTVIGSLFSG